MIFPVNPSEVVHCWPVASVELSRAFDLSETDIAHDHYAMLLQDKEQLWRIGESAWAVTRVTQGKRGRIFEFVALAGSGMREWKSEFFSQAEAWAKRQGCVCAVFSGRRGWTRALPDYSEVRITRMKEL